MGKNEFDGLLADLRNITDNAKAPVVIAIDGMAAAGKTTAAVLLSEALNAEIIHMDDFFLPFELRTAKRYKEPGGNVHYERFNEEAAAAIRLRQAFSYRIFDCGLMDYSGIRHISCDRPIIAEGAYSMHPLYNDIYNYRIFFKIDAELQRSRIQERNGYRQWERFRDEWIPLENRYFNAFNTESVCDAVITAKSD